MLLRGGAEIRGGDVDAEAALRDLREESGKSRGHGGVGQRMNAPRRVAARRDDALLRVHSTTLDATGEIDPATAVKRGDWLDYVAGVAVGQKFNVHHVVDEIKDADGRLLDKVVEQTGVLEVTQVLSQSAVCKLVRGKAAVNDAVK